MFATLIQDTKRAAQDTVTLAYFGAFVDLLIAIALFFFVFAAWHWGAAAYGPVAASVYLGIVFVVLAIIAYVAMRMHRNARERQAEQRHDALRQALSEQFAIDPKWLPSAEAISGGVALARKLVTEKRFRQLAPAVLPALALGMIVIVAYGANQSRGRQES